MQRKYSLLRNIMYTCDKLTKYAGKGYYILALVRIVVEVLVPLLTIALPSVVLALILAEKSPNHTIVVVFLYASLMLLARTILIFLRQKTTILTFLFRIDVMRELLMHVVEMDYEKLESSKGQDMLTKAKRAILVGNEVGIEALINTTVLFFVNIAGLLVYSIISANINIFILLFLFITTLIIVFINKQNRKWLNKHKDEWTPYSKKMEYLYTQSLDTKNGKDIRLYQIKQWFLDSFKELSGKRFMWYQKEYRRYYISNVVERLMGLLRDGLVYTYLIYQMIHGMALDSFILYIGIVAGFSTWMKEIFHSLNEMQMNSDIMSDYRSFMDYGHEKKKEHKENLIKGKVHEIRVEHVSFSYSGSDAYVLKDINLKIKSGEKLALVGMNGAGKSTLIKLICGLYTPTEGKIYLDGIDVSSISKEEYFRKFAVVFQEVFAFAFQLDQNIVCVKKTDSSKERLEKSLKQADLFDRVERFPKKAQTVMLKELDQEGIVLSGGEMQKLMLARALYKDAPVIILDEPTAALDPIAESQMYEKYNSLTQNKTSIFISHRLSSTRFCDRIIFLKQGEIIEQGTHKELMDNNNEYANMFELQSHYYRLEEQEGGDGNER